MSITITKRNTSLFGILTSPKLEKISLVLSIIFLSTPIITVFTNIFDKTETAWWLINQYIGYIGVIIAVFVFIISLQKNNTLPNYIKKNLIPISLFLMFILSLISTLLSSNISLSFYGTAYRCEGFITYIAYLGIFTLGFLIRRKENIFILTNITVSACSILSLFIILNIDSVNRLFNFSTDATVFFNLNHFGYFVALALGLTMALILNAETKSISFYIFVAEYILILLALLQNGSFGPFLSLTVAILVLLILSHIKRKDFLLKAYIIFVVTIIITLIMNFNGSGIINDFLVLFGDVKNVISDSDNANGAGTSRWELWRNGLNFMMEKPFFGYGPENLGDNYLAVNIVYSDRPHCEIIQYAASLGIPAAVCYLTAIGKYIVDFFRSLKKLDRLEFGIVIGVLMYLFSSLFGNTMFYTTPFFFFFLGLSVQNIKNKLY